MAISRLVRSESVPILIGLQGVAPWALLPAYPLLAFAIWKRRVALIVVAGALVAAQLFWMLGMVGWRGPQGLSPGVTKVRLVSANVLYDNQHLPALGDDLAGDRADVVVVQEVTDDVLSAVQQSALWTDYPYRALAPAPFYHGAATFSKYPISNARTIMVGSSPMLLTDLQTSGGTLRLINVHTVAPLTTADARTWADQFADLHGVLDASPYPIVLAGDFNATMDHAPLDRLVHGDVRDAFTVAGSGFGTTWPRWSWPMPSVMRLDHVLVRGAVEVGSVVERTSIGSDHRRLVVELGLR
ncbi:endonuclease/exonuclease/phosphatase family protein [Microbacterium sp. SSW1-49]|uniref:Endonuclease/exonuclease/phosphatase family protein n=1 Tax=Microbacterium croceum TaxID=2851645 RepID=A0ABT0FHL6_9MICO|nr:endonuclease/exonuclease/phosphatase family protein [Microbacterium croceum]MCK2037541.1 endonuclease/exonuclease/phosphatase family protein [Microbacterium croceum]